MLVFRKGLYVGQEIAPKVEKIRSDLIHGFETENAYLITFASGEHDQLNIIHTLFLRKKYTVTHLPVIVGIAGSRREAFQLVKQMLSDALRATGRPDIRRYLERDMETEEVRTRADLAGNG